MSQRVSCPNCGHSFSVEDEWKKYEEIAAEIIGGTLAPPRTAGYDVIDQSGLTYQVKKSRSFSKRKYALCRTDGHGASISWAIGPHREILADFLLLFHVSDEGYLMFLIDKSRADKHIFPLSSGYGLKSGTGNKGWLWNFQVTRQTFLQRRDELLAVRQLSLEIKARSA